MLGERSILRRRLGNQSQEVLPCVVESGVDGFHRNALELCDLFTGVALDLEEDECRAPSWAKLGQKSSQDARGVATLRVAFGIGCGVDHIVEQLASPVPQAPKPSTPPVVAHCALYDA